MLLFLQSISCISADFLNWQRTGGKHDSKYYICDGTFEMAPDSAYQLYTIHGFNRGEPWWSPDLVLSNPTQQDKLWSAICNCRRPEEAYADDEAVKDWVRKIMSMSMLPVLLSITGMERPSTPTGHGESKPRRQTSPVRCVRRQNVDQRLIPYLFVDPLRQRGTKNDERRRRLA